MSSFVRALLTSLVAVPILVYASTASAVTVTIVKYVNGSPATASSTGSASFPMHATFNGSQGDFSLSPTGFNNANPYQATTADMATTSTYGVTETAPNSCVASYPFNIVGYSTGGALADAASMTPASTSPSFSNLQSNEFVVVWNKTCPPSPTLLSPADGSTLTAAQFTSADWSDVTDAASPISYFFESSGSPTVSSIDGSFVSPIFQSSALTSSTIPTSNTPNGTYYWHVRAQDGAGNYGPWSSIFSLTVVSATSTSTTTPTTGAISITKQALGGTGTFSFTGDNSIGTFSIASGAEDSSGNSSGSTTLANLAPGTYNITESALNGWSVQSNTCTGLTVLAGATTTCTIVNTASSTATTTASISGEVFNDGNGNGHLDNNESGLGGWTVTLIAQDGSQQTDVSDGSGMYSFSNLSSGWYWVSNQVKWGWTPTTQLTPVYVSGHSPSSLNFGEQMFRFPQPSHNGHGDGDNDGDDAGGEQPPAPQPGPQNPIAQLQQIIQILMQIRLLQLHVPSHH